MNVVDICGFIRLRLCVDQTSVSLLLIVAVVAFKCVDVSLNDSKVTCEHVHVGIRHHDKCHSVRTHSYEATVTTTSGGLGAHVVFSDCGVFVQK